MPAARQLEPRSFSGLPDVDEFNDPGPLQLAVLRAFRAALLLHCRDSAGGENSEHETELANLMALSGDAWHLTYGEHWQQAAHLYIPTDPVANLAAACGLRYTFRPRGPTGPFSKKPDAIQLTEADLVMITGISLSFRLKTWRKCGIYPHFA